VYPVKICTINSWKGDGNYDERMVLMAKQLLDLQADIICIQECFICHALGVNTLTFLANALQLNANYCGGRKKQRLFKGNMYETESGLGILTRFKTIAHKCVQLPSNRFDEDRKIQQVYLEITDGLHLIVNNVHITHIDIDNTLKDQQLKTLIETIHATKAPQFICGDFNLAETHHLLEAFQQSAGVKDVFEQTNGSTKRCSLVEAASSGNAICVDYIFYKNKAKAAYTIKIINSKVVLNQKDAQGNYPSDHFGYYAECIIDTNE
jgi:endonuclease/exonuclease/phosphatase family metal-dependent hydrolase